MLIGNIDIKITIQQVPFRQYRILKISQTWSDGIKQALIKVISITDAAAKVTAAYIQEILIIISSFLKQFYIKFMPN